MISRSQLIEVGALRPKLSEERYVDLQKYTVGEYSYKEGSSRIAINSRFRHIVRSLSLILCRFKRFSSGIFNFAVKIQDNDEVSFIVRLFLHTWRNLQIYYKGLYSALIGSKLRAVLLFKLFCMQLSSASSFCMLAKYFRLVLRLKRLLFKVNYYFRFLFFKYRLQFVNLHLGSKGKSKNRTKKQLLIRNKLRFVVFNKNRLHWRMMNRVEDRFCVRDVHFLSYLNFIIFSKVLIYFFSSALLYTKYNSLLKRFNVANTLHTFVSGRTNSMYSSINSRILPGQVVNFIVFKNTLQFFFNRFFLKEFIVTQAKEENLHFFAPVSIRSFRLLQRYQRFLRLRRRLLRRRRYYNRYS